MKTYIFTVMISLVQNSIGIDFLIDKSNAEYCSNTIYVSNCNDILSAYDMCVHLISNALATPKVPFSEYQLRNKITSKIEQTLRYSGRKLV